MTDKEPRAKIKSFEIGNCACCCWVFKDRSLLYPNKLQRDILSNITWRNTCVLMVGFCRVRIANEQLPVDEESCILNAHVIPALSDSM